MVDLFEALSHTELSEALEKLSRRDWQPERRPPLPPYGRPGHRKLGSVTDAVVQVLSDAGSEMRYVDVHRAVETLLGGPVARSSIKNALAKGSSGRRPRFERVGRGRYRSVTPAGQSL